MDTRGEAYPSNNWIANKLGIYPRSVPRSLERLEERGHVTRLEINGKRHLITGKPISAEHLTSAKSYPQGVSRQTGGDVISDTQLDQNNIISKIITYDDKEKTNTTPPKASLKPNIKTREKALSHEERYTYERLVAIKGVFKGAAMGIVENHTLAEINSVLEAAKAPNVKSRAGYILGIFFGDKAATL